MINRGSSSILKEKQTADIIQRSGTKSAEKIIQHSNDDDKIKISHLTNKSSPSSISAQKLEIESPSPESINTPDVK